MLHHYTEFMESELIQQADQTVEQLINDYRAVENNTYTNKGYTTLDQPLFPLF